MLHRQRGNQSIIMSQHALLLKKKRAKIREWVENSPWQRGMWVLVRLSNVVTLVFSDQSWFTRRQLFCCEECKRTNCTPEP